MTDKYIAGLISEWREVGEGGKEERERGREGWAGGRAREDARVCTFIPCARARARTSK